MSADLDRLTKNVLGAIETAARRAVQAASMVLGVVTVVVTTTFLLGLLALAGSARWSFAFIALCFGGCAIGAAWLGRWRLGISLRSVPSLSSELRQLLATDEDARDIVDAYVVNHHDGDGIDTIVADPAPLATNAHRSAGVFGLGGRLAGLRQLSGDGLRRFATLSAVVAGARSYPFLALVALAITAAFGVIGCVLVFMLIAKAM